jgi:intracellular multiplication protein IcmG
MSMADNENYDDEYQFVDPDAGSSEPMDHTPDTGTAAPASGEQSFMDKTFAGKSGVIRNSLIVVGIIIAGMIIYPFVHSALTGSKKPSVISAIPPEKMVQKPVVAVIPQPVSTPVPEVQNLNADVTQKLSTLQQSQERMQTEVASTGNQIAGINNSITEMTAKVTELNRIILLYATKVDEQSRVVAQLVTEAEALKKAKKKHVVIRHKILIPAVKYYIQAVIPGRAWLIGSNGVTLTVREGTMIAGLGMVKLIDPRQGRVLTSSGQVIRFSQEDS